MVTERRSIRWLPIILQTIVLLGAVVGFAIANEHRITILEECSKTTAEALKQTTDRLEEMQHNMVRTIAVLEAIERRHDNEDDRK